jgi:putative oxidoreductase
MKYVPAIAGVLLGLIFLLASVPMLLGMITPDKMPPPATPEAKLFGEVFGPTGYMTFVKVCELLGAILVIIPKTRNWGLLVLGPIVVNIVAYIICVEKAKTLANPLMIAAVVLSLYLLWDARKKFAGLLN